MSRKMKKALKYFDYWLGYYTSNECIGFQEVVGFDSQSKDTMNLVEWQSYRKGELTENDTWHSWMNLLATEERRKFLLFDFLTTKLSRNGKILDLGCGQGHVSIMLFHAGYQIVLSDFDETVIPKKLPPYNKLFSKYDLLSISSEELQEFSDILLVQVDYIFDGSVLEKFLKKCQKSQINVHFINTQILGPFRFLKFKYSETDRLKEPKLKVHGLMRSVGFYKRLAHSAGYTKLHFQRLQRIKSPNEDMSSYFYFGFLCNASVEK